MANPIYVLGTGLSHDGSACLLKDGEVCVAIEKERITRLKHDGFNDSAAIKYCLDAAGITMKEVALVVQNTTHGMFERGNDHYHGPRVLDSATPVATLSHHLAHAYSAFATSPFEEANVLVLDNGGNSLDECLDLAGAVIPVTPEQELQPLYSEVDSYYHFGPEGVRTIFKDFSPPAMSRKPYCMYPRYMMHSIGGVYGIVSVYVFRGMEDPGKLMGLAPYGRKGVYDFPMFDLRDGRVFVRYDWQKDFNTPCADEDSFKARFQYYADLALWTQKEVERAILYVIENRSKMGHSNNLCYAGGVALNAVANRRILKEGSFQRVFVPPAAGDNGIALGCAYYGWLRVLGRQRVMHSGSTLFGKVYPRHEVDAAIAAAGASHLVWPVADYSATTAQLLAAGHLVAWFQNGAEFGPRALGNRSILADPRRPAVADFINREVKRREDFRPFAPSVPLEDVGCYFDCDYESPYMLLVAQVRPEWREIIPSVVHRDQSARIQTVVEDVNPTYYRLLKDFKAATGISVLLNTSLNRRGVPIVETPAEALSYFLDSALDVLVLNDVVLCKPDKRPIDA